MDMVEKLITASPFGAALLIMCYMFLKRMEGMSKTHQQCLAMRDRAFVKTAGRLAKSIDKNTKSTADLDATIRRAWTKKPRETKK